jgi:hypothetical protein
MDLIQILIALIVVGALLYILNLLPIDQTLKTIAYVIVIVVVAIYALRILAPMAGLG